MEWCEKETVDVVKLIHLREMLSLAKENNKKTGKKNKEKDTKKQKHLRQKNFVIFSSNSLGDRSVHH